MSATSVGLPIALITGATSGFGRATAERFAASGWRVVATGRRAERLEELQQALGGPHVCYVAAFDIRDREATERFYAELPPSWKPIDLLFNNAGLARGMAPLDGGLVSDWEEMIDTNVKGLLYISRVVAADMRQRGSGHILNMGSTAAKEAYANGNVYCATKHAVDALTRCLRLDLLGTGVKVSAIHPGAAETEFSRVRFHGDDARAAKVYEGFQPLQATDVAEVVWFMANQPAHVNIADVVLMSTAQASARDIARNG
jgi:NADP-dependent 3-hydroxy acid dehydrogenase YdfG